MALDLRTRTLEVNERTYAAWNAHDADAVAAVFAEDAVLREAGRAEEIRGRAAIRARAAALLTAFPDFRLERIVLVIDGERHADRWVMTGTHRGDLFGIPATGRAVRHLYAGVQPSGEHAVTWDGRDDAGAALSSGVYHVRVAADGQSGTQKIVLLK